MNCEFCKNIFGNKHNLKTHQKTAKYCLKIQGKTSSKIFSCKICDDNFTTKQHFQRHMNTHNDIDRKNYKHIIELEAENENLKNEFKNQLLYYQDIIFKQEKNIERLERVIERIASKPVNVTTNTTNNTNTLNICNFQPITSELITQEAQKLTIENIGDKDGIGYAMFAENIFKDKLACTDYARSVLKWKNEEDIICDPKGEKLWRLFCTAVCSHNEDMYKEIATRIELREGEDPVEFMNKIVAYTDNLSAVQGGKRGESSDLQRVVIEHLCRIFKR
jgi:hypothetical protein